MALLELVCDDIGFGVHYWFFQTKGKIAKAYKYQIDAERENIELSGNLASQKSHRPFCS